MIVRGDVNVRALVAPQCEICNDREVATAVVLDLRAIGQSIVLGHYCAACAASEVTKLRDALPETES